MISRIAEPDTLAHAVVFVAGSTIVAITALLVYELWINSEPSRVKFGWSFLFTQNWDPMAGQFGALPFIFGTVVTSVLALLIAVPLGVGAATFLAELAPPRISDALTFCIELLAAVPSVIFGLIGIFVLVPALAGGGAGAEAGARKSADLLRSILRSQRILRRDRAGQS